MVPNKPLLLDTHMLIWWMNGDPRFRKDLISVIANPQTQVYCSVVSLWELAVKESLGKIVYPKKLESFLKTYAIEVLNVTQNHVAQLRLLPMLHKDPFDRLLIAQAKAEGMVLVTVDKQISQYDVHQLMC